MDHISCLGRGLSRRDTLIHPMHDAEGASCEALPEPLVFKQNEPLLRMDIWDERTCSYWDDANVKHVGVDV